jgi:hypothetical protein
MPSSEDVSVSLPKLIRPGTPPTPPQAIPIARLEELVYTMNLVLMFASERFEYSLTVARPGKPEQL